VRSAQHEGKRPMSPGDQYARRHANGPSQSPCRRAFS
jgi:hypothetical protein